MAKIIIAVFGILGAFIGASIISEKKSKEIKVDNYEPETVFDPEDSMYKAFMETD